MLSGYAPHTEAMLEKSTEDGAEKSPVWFNGVVRSKETVILFNLGETSAPLDIHIYPKADMAAGTVKLSQGVGGQKVSFPRCHECGGRCGAACRFEGMHEKRRGIQKGRLFPVQRGLGFQAQCGGRIRQDGTAAVFLAGDAGRRDKVLTVCDRLMKAE